MLEAFKDAFVRYHAIKYIDKAFLNSDNICLCSYDEIETDLSERIPDALGLEDISSIEDRVEVATAELLTIHGIAEIDGQLSFIEGDPSEIAKKVYGEYLKAKSALEDFSYANGKISVRQEVPEYIDGEIADESVLDGFRKRNIQFAEGETLEFTEKIYEEILVQHEELLGKNFL